MITQLLICTSSVERMGVTARSLDCRTSSIWIAPPFLLIATGVVAGGTTASFVHGTFASEARSAATR
jgi:hypothetical protein